MSPSLTFILFYCLIALSFTPSRSQQVIQFGTSFTDKAYGITADTTNAVYVTGYKSGAFYGTSAGNSDAFYTFFCPPMTAEPTAAPTSIPTAAPTQQIAGGKSKSKSRLNVGIVVGAGIGVGLCLVAIGAVYLYFIRKKSNDGKNVSDDIKFTMVDNKGDVVLKNIEVSQEDIEFAKVDNVEEVVVKNNGVQENNI